MGAGISQWTQLDDGRWVSEKNPGYPFLAAPFSAGSGSCAPRRSSTARSAASPCSPAPAAGWAPGAARGRSACSAPPAWRSRSPGAPGCRRSPAPRWWRPAPARCCGRSWPATPARRAGPLAGLLGFVALETRDARAVHRRRRARRGRRRRAPRPALRPRPCSHAGRSGGGSGRWWSPVGLVLAWDQLVYGSALATGYASGVVTFGLGAIRGNLANMPRHLTHDHAGALARPRRTRLDRGAEHLAAPDRSARPAPSVPRRRAPRPRRRRRARRRLGGQLGPVLPLRLDRADERRNGRPHGRPAAAPVGRPAEAPSTWCASSSRRWPPSRCSAHGRSRACRAGCRSPPWPRSSGSASGRSRAWPPRRREAGRGRAACRAGSRAGRLRQRASERRLRHAGRAAGAGLRALRGAAVTGRAVTAGRAVADGRRRVASSRPRRRERPRRRTARAGGRPSARRAPSTAHRGDQHRGRSRLRTGDHHGVVDRE